MMSSYLKGHKVKDGIDVNAIIRSMMFVIVEGALDEAVNEELGYSKSDYRNRNTDNSRNGYSQKNMHTGYGDIESHSCTYLFLDGVYRNKTANPVPGTKSYPRNEPSVKVLNKQEIQRLLRSAQVKGSKCAERFRYRILTD